MSEFVVEDLQPSRRHEIYVQTIDDRFEGKQTDPIQVVAADLRPFSAPTNLRINGEGKEELEIAWNPPDIPNGRLLGYKIIYDAADCDSEAKTTSAPINRVNLAALKPGTCYRIQGTDLGGCESGVVEGRRGGKGVETNGPAMHRSGSCQT